MGAYFLVGRGPRKTGTRLVGPGVVTWSGVLSDNVRVWSGEWRHEGQRDRRDGVLTSAPTSVGLRKHSWRTRANTFRWETLQLLSRTPLPGYKREGECHIPEDSEDTADGQPFSWKRHGSLGVPAQVYQLLTRRQDREENTMRPRQRVPARRGDMRRGPSTSRTSMRQLHFLPPQHCHLR